MAGAVAERVRRYIFDGTDQDLRRLLRISELSAEMARAAFLRIGSQEGWSAIDCGCGPLYTRLFLMHQPDPVRTLRRIAGLLRPGGWLVTQEALRSPPPRSHPDLEALSGYWDLVYEVLDGAGVPAGAVEDLPRSARQAGLEVAGVSGCFLIMDPELGFEVHAASLAAARERATRLGIAARRVDDLVRDIRAAADGGFEWVSTGFVLDLTLRKPAAP